MTLTGSEVHSSAMASNTCTPRERMNSFSLLGLLSPTATVNVNPEGNLSEEKAGELRLQLAALDVAAVAAVPVVPAAVARDDMYVCVKQCIVRDSVDASGAKLGELPRRLYPLYLTPSPPHRPIIQHQTLALALPVHTMYQPWAARVCVCVYGGGGRITRV